MGKTILEAKDLSFSYDGRNPVFEHVNFKLEEGDVLVILGANGSGKTTLLNCLTGMLAPTSGEVLVRGESIDSYSINDLARVMGYVPQISTPVYSYTIRDYVVMGRAPYMGILRVPKDREYAVADDVIRRMHIEKLADKIYSQVSGGERQQAQIARVLAQQPDIVLLDEPANHLDYGNQFRIIGLVSRMAEKDGIAVVLTSHNPDHALLIGRSVGMLDHQGRFDMGPVDQIMDERRLSELYGLEIHLVYVDRLSRIVCVSGRRGSERKDAAIHAAPESIQEDGKLSTTP